MPSAAGVDVLVDPLVRSIDGAVPLPGEVRHTVSPAARGSSTTAAWCPDTTPAAPPLGQPRQPLPSFAVRELVVGSLFESCWFSVDGRWFAAGGQNKALVLQDVTDQAQSRVLVRRKANILTSSLSPDGRSFVVGGADGLLCHYSFPDVERKDDPAAGVLQPLWELDMGSHVCGAVWNCSGSFLATVCENDQVQIVDPRAGAVTHTLAGRTEGFDFVGGSRWGGYSIDFSPTLMAVTGGGPDFKKVRLWRVPELTVHETLAYTSNVYCCQFRPDFQVLAVGLDGGTLHMHDVSSLDRPSLRIEVGSRWGFGGGVRAIRFSPDGQLMVCGQWSGDFSTFVTNGVDTAHKISCLHIKESNGVALAFSPAGDRIAAGGGSFQAIRFLTSPTHPAQPTRRFDITPAIEDYQSSNGNVARAAANTDVGDALLAAEVGEDSKKTVHTVKYAEVTRDFAVLASGSYLVVLRRTDGSCVNVIDMQSSISGTFQAPRAISVSHDQTLAVLVLETKRLQVITFPAGDVRHSVGPFGSRVFGCVFASDGSAFFAHGDFGAEGFTTDTGASIGKFDDQIQVLAVSTSFDVRRRLLATAGQHKSIMIYDVDSRKVVRRLECASTTLGVCFDRTGSRIAFSSQTQTQVASVDSGEILCTFLPPVMASTRLEFSPVDNDLVIQGSGMGRGGAKVFGRMLRILSVSNSGETDYSALMHSAVDLATILAATVGCAASIVAQESEEPKLLVHAAETSSLVQFDVEEFRRAVDDGAFSTKQLVALSLRRPDKIVDVAGRFPEALNIQDSDGNTVLHALAEEDRRNETETWLSADASFTPIANSAGVTALHIATSRFNVGLCLALVRHLSKALSPASARLLTDDIRTLAATMPRLLPVCLQAMEHENAVFQQLSYFRANLDRTEVRGQDKLHHAYRLDRGAPEAGLWDDLKEQGHAAKGNGVRVLCKVLMMSGFIGAADVSPFHAITQNCDSTVFRSKLMQLAVQFKWETNVSRLVSLHLGWHICVLTLASATMVTTTQAQLRDEGSSQASEASSLHVAAAQIALAVVVVLDLCANHILKVCRLGGSLYWQSGWSQLEVVSGLSLLLAVGFEWFGDQEAETAKFVQSSGAVGTALKWIGLLDYFRSGRQTGALVRMVIVVAKDMVPFLGVLGVAAMGATFFFAIDMPGTINYSSNPTVGFFWPAVTMIRALLGNFDITDYGKWTSIVVFCLTTFFIMLLMLNLLIAIMGDSYDKVKEREAIEGLREKARTIVAMELFHPKLHAFPRFMHIAEPESDMISIATLEAKRNHGIGGRITNKVLEMLDERLEETEKRAAKREATLRDELVEVKELLTTLLDQVKA